MYYISQDAMHTELPKNISYKTTNNKAVCFGSRVVGREQDNDVSSDDALRTVHLEQYGLNFAPIS